MAKIKVRSQCYRLDKSYISGYQQHKKREEDRVTFTRQIVFYTYTIENIHDIHLDTNTIGTIITDAKVMFSGGHSMFTDCSTKPSLCTDDDRITFNSTEQYEQYAKAIHQREIMTAVEMFSGRDIQLQSNMREID